ncbi:MAG: C4-dicarboxylate ABC transporter substrate-binding protein [Hyphomicrobiaceae bacterium]
MKCWHWATALLIAAVLGLSATRDEAAAQARDEAAAGKPIKLAQRAVRRPIYRSQSEQTRKELINANTVGLAAGRIEGAPLRFAAELARVLDDGTKMRVLPIVTRGIFDNIFDLLYLRGVDAAIVYGDVLEHFKKNPEISGISKRINYLASLFPAELHILARPEIKSLADLAGKRVNFNTEGTAAAYSGPIILDRLGIKVDAKFIPHSVAMGQMKKGPEFAAVVFVSSKPLGPFVKGNWPPGFHFLPVQYTDALDYYLPAYLEHTDYPALIPQGQRITTIAVPAVLAVYDWPTDTDRYRRMKRFVDYLMDRLPQLQSNPGFHKAWKDVNLAAAVPGWKRFGPLQERLDAAARAAPATKAKPTAAESEAARQQAARVAPDDPAEQERLFLEFMEWRRKQQQ